MFGILMGLPGVGKGTQCAMLKERDMALCLSPGEILREKLNSGDSDVESLRNLINSGTLLPDEFIIKLVENNLQSAKISERLDSVVAIFDGIPRTVEQAKMLDDVLMKSYQVSINKVVFLQAKRRVILKRLSARVVCAKCNKVSNVLRTKSFKCDCGSNIFKRRKDDDVAIIRKRIKTDTVNSGLIYKYYLSSGVQCLKVNGNANQSVVYKRLKNFLFTDKI